MAANRCLRSIQLVQLCFLTAVSHTTVDASRWKFSTVRERKTDTGPCRKSLNSVCCAQSLNSPVLRSPSDYWWRNFFNTQLLVVWPHNYVAYKPFLTQLLSMLTCRASRPARREEPVQRYSSVAYRHSAHCTTHTHSTIVHNYSL